MATRESDLSDWGRDRLLAMRETDTIVTRAMTGATVRCDPHARRSRPMKRRWGVAADAAELKDLATRVRTSRYGEDKSDRRQSAAGQVAGLITEVVTVRELIEGMLSDATRLAEQLPSVAKGEVHARRSADRQDLIVFGPRDLRRAHDAVRARRTRRGPEERGARAPATD